VATFYLLPPRPLLADRFADFLRSLFPDLKIERADPAVLSEFLEEIAGKQPAVFLVHREELPDGEDATTALRDHFGAESGDEVVEIRGGTARRWHIAG
jgi:hypothetical protein